MAATSATATMSVSTSAMNGVASNTMGATTAINNMGITTTVSTTIGADASTSTISSVESKTLECYYTVVMAWLMSIYSSNNMAWLMSLDRVA